jgi:hypothetical protein
MQLGNEVMGITLISLYLSLVGIMGHKVHAIMAHNPHTILILVILVWEVLWAPKCHNKSIIGIKFYPCNLHCGHFLVWEVLGVRLQVP